MNEVGKQVMGAALTHLVREGYYDPCVAVLYDGDEVEYLYPRFQNEDERRDAFKKVNEYITDSGAVAAILVMETWHIPKGTREGEKQEALMMLLKSHGMSRVEAFPFRREGDEIKFEEKITTSAQRDTMLTAFQSTH